MSMVTARHKEKMMANQKRTKKKNPQDATLRNIRALKKRVAALEIAFKLLNIEVAGLLMKRRKNKSRNTEGRKG